MRIIVTVVFFSFILTNFCYSQCNIKKNDEFTDVLIYFYENEFRLGLNAYD